MEARKENWKYFVTYYPKSHKAYKAFGEALEEESSLDKKTSALIKVGIAAASQFDYALRSHIEKALRVGCKADEVEHAILLTVPTIGFPRMMAALLIFRDEMGKEVNQK